MIVVTTPEVPGRRVQKVLGMVRGNTIRARHVGRDIQAKIRNITGGEVHEYTKMMAETREQAIDRMIEEAEKVGADAVVNLRFATSYVMSSASEILAYGDAVKLMREPEVTGF